jgi:hypothetical protein
MKFRTLFILNRVIAPAAFTLLAVGMLLPSGPAAFAFRVLGGVPFVLVGIFGAFKGLEIQRNQFLTVQCPFCEQDGIAGCGVGGGVGWWLRCEGCGIVMPKGLLGLSFIRMTEEEYENGRDDEE